MECGELVFTEHAKRRARVRKLDLNQLKEVVMNADEVLYDVKEKHYIALDYSSKLVVVFDKEKGKCIIITAYYSSKIGETVAKRKERGRWVEVEL